MALTGVTSVLDSEVKQLLVADEVDRVEPLKAGPHEVDVDWRLAFVLASCALHRTPVVWCCVGRSVCLDTVFVWSCVTGMLELPTLPMQRM